MQFSCLSKPDIISIILGSHKEFEQDSEFQD